MIRVMGVDPGLAGTGIGMVSGRGSRVAGFAYGDIRTEPRDPVPERLNRIYERMTEILRSERPHRMVVEAVFFLPRHPASGLDLGKVVGVVQLAAARAAVPVSEVPVREAKHVLTGNGAADKNQLERAVRRALKISAPIRPFHASDALALALVGLYRFSSASVPPPFAACDP